jgi:hypothetical protein
MNSEPKLLCTQHHIEKEFKKRLGEGALALAASSKKAVVWRASRFLSTGTQQLKCYSLFLYKTLASLNLLAA